MSDKPIDKIKKIVDESVDSQECCKKLIEDKLAISFGEGRRFWGQLKNRDKK
jgi:hypothetical protein